MKISTTWKALLSAGSFIGIAIITLLPFIVQRLCNLRRRKESESNLISRKSKSLLECLVNCFSAGVFMGTAFLHLLPETLEHYKEVISLGRMSDFDTWNNSGEDHHDEHHAEDVPHPHGFPVSMVIVMAGFFFGYFAELLTDSLMKFCEKRRQRHHHYKQGILPSDLDREKMLLRISQDTSTTLSSSATSSNSGHGHASADGVREGKLSDGVTLVAALALHSVLEGLVIGISVTVKAFTTRLVTILLHKVFVSLVVGALLAKSASQKSKIVFALLVTVFAASTPLGMGLGTGLTSDMGNLCFIYRPSTQLAIVILEAISTGMFIYIAFLELLMKECMQPKWPWIKAFSVLSGVVVVGILMFLLAH